MTATNVEPSWIRVRWGVYNLLPFPKPGEPIPRLPRFGLIGRVVRDVDTHHSGMSPIGSKAHAWLCDNGAYSLDDVHQKARNQVRKGFREGAEISRLSWEEAWPQIEQAVQETMQRQERHGVAGFLEQLLQLKRYDQTVWGNAVDVWIVRRKGIVGAIVVGVKYGDSYFILHEFSISSELPWCPNNALVFEVTRRALGEAGCRQVNYGVEGLDSGGFEGLSRFKSRMGYRLCDCQEEFHAHGLIVLLVKSAGMIASAMLRIFPRLSKIQTLRVLTGLRERL